MILIKLLIIGAIPAIAIFVTHVLAPDRSAMTDGASLRARLAANSMTVEDYATEELARRSAEELSSFLHDPDPRVRKNALRAARFSMLPQGLDWLFEGLSDQSRYARYEAALGVEELAGPGDSMRLRRAIAETRDADVRSKLQSALDRIEKSATPGGAPTPNGAS